MTDAETARECGNRPGAGWNGRAQARIAVRGYTAPERDRLGASRNSVRLVRVSRCLGLRLTLTGQGAPANRRGSIACKPYQQHPALGRFHPANESRGCKSASVRQPFRRFPRGKG
jgi:hypothetical protein